MNTPDTSLQRFLDAQAETWSDALAELRNGCKEGHWMWFIFPQIAGLGRSETSRHFAIRNLGEARAYLAHPVLGPRLRECTAALLDHAGTDIESIFGYPDNLKLHSSLTLFAVASDDEDSIFTEALDTFFRGDQDLRTLEILGQT